MKNIVLIILLTFFSCSLYQNNDEPNIFFQFSDFEILELGKSFSDMIISDVQSAIYLSDYNNNSVLKINTQNSLLWILPYITLIFGGFFIFSFLKKRQ